MAWGAVGLVIVVVAVLVIVKVAGGSTSRTTSYTPVTPAPASVVKDVTNIPRRSTTRSGSPLVGRRLPTDRSCSRTSRR